MSTIEQSVDVNVPIRTAYNQWTQFESFPEFMEGVESIKQVSDTRTAWVVEIAGVRREFEAEITEQHPDERVAWKSVDAAAPGRRGDLPPARRRTPPGSRSSWSTTPRASSRRSADWLQIVRMRVRGDLERFKTFIEARGGETGAWRGEVPGPHERGEGPADEGLGGSRGPGAASRHRRRLRPRRARASAHGGPGAIRRSPRSPRPAAAPAAGRQAPRGGAAAHSRAAPLTSASGARAEVRALVVRVSDVLDRCRREPGHAL